MSKADEMFKKIGYKIDEDEERITVYKTNCADSKIYICVFHNTEDSRFKLKFYEQYCSIKLLQAINKKCEELGWLDE